MKESVTYQAILEEGETRGIAKGEAQGNAEQARRMLLLFGRDNLGEPSGAARAALDVVSDVNHLEDLALQVKHAASWEELLGLAVSRRTSRRKRSS